MNCIKQRNINYVISVNTINKVREFIVKRVRWVAWKVHLIYPNAKRSHARVTRLSGWSDFSIYITVSRSCTMWEETTAKPHMSKCSESNITMQRYQAEHMSVIGCHCGDHQHLYANNQAARLYTTQHITGILTYIILDKLCNSKWLVKT